MTAVSVSAPAIDRFEARVRRTDGCWLWMGHTNRDGYGVMHDAGPIGAHRWSYQHYVGPIPAGSQLDHLCRVRNCVNPAHLEPVTQAENILRGEAPPAENSRKVLCLRGHEFTGANTYVNPRGSRECRQCRRDRHHLRRAARVDQS